MSLRITQQCHANGKDVTRYLAESTIWKTTLEGSMTKVLLLPDPDSRARGGFDIASRHTTDRVMFWRPGGEWVDRLFSLLYFIWFCLIQSFHMLFEIRGFCMGYGVWIWWGGMAILYCWWIQILWQFFWEGGGGSFLGYMQLIFLFGSKINLLSIADKNTKFLTSPFSFRPWSGNFT